QDQAVAARARRVAGAEAGVVRTACAFAAAERAVVLAADAAVELGALRVDRAAAEGRVRAADEVRRAAGADALVERIGVARVRRADRVVALVRGGCETGDAAGAARTFRAVVADGADV